MPIKTTIAIASALVAGASSVALAGPAVRHSHPPALRTEAPPVRFAPGRQAYRHAYDYAPPARFAPGWQAYGYAYDSPYAWTTGREPTYMAIQTQSYRDNQ